MGDEADLLRKINLILKKAEGTDNANEAQTFFEAAHNLMVKYAIDEARVRAEAKAASRGRLEEPVVEDYMFSSYAHHAQAKQDLFTMVAEAHSVRSFPYGNQKYSNATRVAKAGGTGLHESQWTQLVGYKDDIEMVKLLYLSLLVQSSRFAAEDWRSRYGSAKVSSWDDGHLGKFAWMSAHMEGFADRIGERFKELTEEIYRNTAGANALILDKDANILEWMYEHGILRRPSEATTTTWLYCWAHGVPPGKRSEYYCLLKKHHDEGDDPTPHIFSYKPAAGSSYVAVGRRSSYEGRNAGRSAADRADIGLRRTGSGTSQLKG